MPNKVFNINPSSQFLPTLANWILVQYPDPFYLSNLTILLPSRRACREIKKIFLELSKTKALILPKILAIGDVDYDNFQPIINNNLQLTTYNLQLIASIKDWNKKTNLFGQNISTAALAGIADNLQVFLDEVEKESLNLDDLKQIDDADLASHKQQILQFLQYFASVWQNILLKDGLISKAKKQSLMLKNYNDFLKLNGSQFPIIAAGSTGSVCAASDLLKTIVSLDLGSVVLFGLDQKLDEEIWDKIEENHPQFMLKKLLMKLEEPRKNVINIGENENNFIDDLCRKIMLPAEFSDRWEFDKSATYDLRLATYDYYLKIEPENEFDEAKIIAFLFREALETKDKTAALISNDKNLIGLVRENLRAFQIEVDDSASSNLAESELANYLFLISEFCLNDFSGVNLLAVLKHPLTNLNNEFLKILELEILRNVVKFSGFDDLILKIKDVALKNWITQIADLFKPLINEFKKDEIDFVKVSQLHFECFESLTNSHGKHDSQINKIDGFTELSEFIQELTTLKTTPSTYDLRLTTYDSKSYTHLLQNLLKNYQFRKSGNFHPRLHILSTMEARLMSYDLTIVSGLVEGEFPAKSSDDWLGNKIRTEIGLSSKARKIGIAAYDFCNYLKGKQVVLLCPKNQNNAPTIKSRFLLKMEAILKLNSCEDFFKNGAEYLQLLNLDFQPQIIEKTNPKPIQKLEKISVTDISKWLRNPYYIYAKRILELKPLKQIEQEASFAEFGNFVHKALEEFVKNYPDVDLLVFGKKIFADYFPDSTSHLLWWPRFENIAGWFLKYEKNLRSNLQKSFVEIEAKALIGGVLMTTKIDRVNFYSDGSLEIIDYKTGKLPEPKEIKSGLEPQLAMEAIILSQGNIKNYPELNGKINLLQIKNLQYQNLKGKNQNEIEDLKNPSELINAAEVGIVRLLEIFADENFGYVVAPNLDIYKEDDYYYLSRLCRDK